MRIRLLESHFPQHDFALGLPLAVFARPVTQLPLVPAAASVAMAALTRVHGDSILMPKRWVVATLAGYQESYRTGQERGLRLERRRDMTSRPCDSACPSGNQGLNKAMSARERTRSHRCRHVPGVSLAFALLAHPAMAESHATASAAGHAHAEDVSPLLPTANPGPSGDLFPATAQTLDQAYDQYTAFKNTMQTTTNVQIAMPVSIFWQAGTPNGGPSTAELVYSPVASWTPFKDTAIGSGTFTFAFQGNQFWTGANTDAQQSGMGLLVPPNAWGENNYQYSQITYTHALPGDWLSVSVGQYSFADYDGNEYAGNTQTNFINYALSQNGTQAYANAGLGAYAQVSAVPHILIAAGFQNATDVLGRTLTTSGYSNGQIAWFGVAQWTPDILAGGAYGIIYYNQPSVPLQPSASQGISFSASQNLDTRFGVFLRVNNASGAAIPITTSIAFGGVINDPFGRNRPDQGGLGFAWSKVNQTETGEPTRHAEEAAELYYAITIFKGLQITPDVQVTLNPVFAPSTSVAAVFSVRTTFNF